VSAASITLSCRVDAIDDLLLNNTRDWGVSNRPPFELHFEALYTVREELGNLSYKGVNPLFHRVWEVIVFPAEESALNFFILKLLGKAAVFVLPYEFLGLELWLEPFGSLIELVQPLLTLC
jgi:hypothetical protein